MTVLDLLSPRPTAKPSTAQEQSAPSPSPESDKTGTAMETESEDGHNKLNGDIRAHQTSVDEDDASENSQEHDNKKHLNKPRTYLKAIWDDFTKIRNLSGKIVNDTKTQLFIILLIAVNAIMLGLATFPFVKDDPDVARSFEITDKVFLVIFTVELFMQFLYNGLYLFLDGWLIFDFVIIVSSWSFEQIQIVRAFRIFRAFRLITRVKVLKNLLTALFSVMPRLGAISLLLALTFFIFSILMTSLWKDLWHDGLTSQDYFSRLDATLFTLFQIMTLDEWAGISREVMAVQSWAWLPFIAFVLISAFVVVNLIIAVICDAIGALHSDQRSMVYGENVNDGADVLDIDLDAQDVDDVTYVPIDVKEQLNSLEQQVEELTQMQEQTMHTLQYLTRHLQANKLEITSDE